MSGGGDSRPCCGLSRMSLDSQACQHAPLPASSERAHFFCWNHMELAASSAAWPLSVMGTYKVWLLRLQIIFVLPQVQLTPNHSHLTVTTFLRSSLAMQGNPNCPVTSGAKPGSLCWLCVVGGHQPNPRTLRHKLLLTPMSLTCTTVIDLFPCLFVFRVE